MVAINVRRQMLFLSLLFRQGRRRVLLVPQNLHHLG
jgi:hypothetical protein